MGRELGWAGQAFVASLLLYAGQEFTGQRLGRAASSLWSSPHTDCGKRGREEWGRKLLCVNMSE